MPTRPATSEDLDRVERLIERLAEDRAAAPGGPLLTRREVETLLELPAGLLSLERRLDAVEARLGDVERRLGGVQVALTGDGERPGLVARLGVLPAELAVRRLHSLYGLDK